jgi:protein ImuA
MKPGRPAILRRLARQIRKIEDHDLRSRPVLSFFGTEVEQLFPGGRLPAGSLVEVLAVGEGGGSWTFSILLANKARADKAFVVVDMSRCFYPPAAQRLGVDLARTLIVHPTNPRAAGAVLGAVLRCPAVGAVVADCPHLGVQECRQLQLAAEAGGGLGIVVRPATAAHEPSFATTRLLVSPLVSPAANRCFQVEVLRCRAGKNGCSLVLEVDDATGDVRLLAGLAPAAASPGTPRVAN